MFAGILPRLHGQDEDEDDEDEDDEDEADASEPSDDPPPSDAEDWHWQRIRFELMYIQHGGSGLGMRFGDVNELDVEEIFYLINSLLRRRKKEADAIKSASSKPAPR